MSMQLEKQAPQQPAGPLQDSHAEIQARNAEFEQFIYTVSHDLKSPLVTVQGFAGLLERDLREGRTERLADFAQQIKAGVMQMAGLIDDLLNLSRIGRISRKPEPVDLADLTRKILRLHQMEIDEKAVSVEVQHSMPWVRVDKERIADVIENLVSNALKHGDNQQDARIEIGAEETPDEIRYYVKDNGPGIDRSYHRKVFDLFEKLDSNSEGTGVGLALVKRAMEVHGGKAWVESAPGQGAVFWISFPRSLVVPAADQPREDEHG